MFAASFTMWSSTQELFRSGAFFNHVALKMNMMFRRSLLKAVARFHHMVPAARPYAAAQVAWATLLQNPKVPADSPMRSGWQVYSQCDEDGIINEILRRIGAPGKFFLEIAPGDGRTNNTAFLMAQGWRGAWVECGRRQVRDIKAGFGGLISEGILQFSSNPVTRENLTKILATFDMPDEIDLLSLDIDGNDYHLLDELTNLKPRICVLEYNPRYPPSVEWVMPYDAEHRHSGTDYYGSSLAAQARKMIDLGYSLVACSIAGVNAFYVRDDLVDDHFPSAGQIATHYMLPAHWMVDHLAANHAPDARTICTAARSHH